MKILITGTAGFIGFHLAKRLLNEGHDIFGLDNLNNYYDVNLKNARLDQLKKFPKFVFVKTDLTNKQDIEKIFSEYKFERVLHLAAQAGVRYSIENPDAYIQSNIVGFMNILEACRASWSKEKLKTPDSRLLTNHLVYASSSSVYGLNTKLPFSVNDNVDHPISLYAATKKANELMAHTYSYLYGIPTTGLRFFTVYGPWGRPDMALFKFTKAIMNDETIDIYNNGNMQRDFTYIDDIVEGVIRVSASIPESGSDWNQNTPGKSTAPYRIYNIGNNNPVKLMDFVYAIEKSLDKKAKINFMPMQPGDVPETYADVTDLVKDVDYKPATKIEEGVSKFIEWYKEYRSCCIVIDN